MLNHSSPGDRRIDCEEHGYGKLRSRSCVPSEKLRGAVDHVSLCGWHECNDRYLIRRESNSSASGDAIVLMTLRGEGFASMGGRRYRLEENTVMLLPRGSLHTYGVPSGSSWTFYWMHLSGERLCALVDYIAREYGLCLKISCMDELAQLAEQLISSDLSYCDYELFAAKTIMDLICRLVQDVGRPSAVHDPHSALVRRLINYIEKNCGRPLQLKELAARFYLSPEHIIRVFRSETGMTPHQYICSLRMKRACIYLLESDMSVEAITSAVGYRSSSTFIAQFRQRLGMTPGDYRSSHKKAPAPTGTDDKEERT